MKIKYGFSFTKQKANDYVTPAIAGLARLFCALGTRHLLDCIKDHDIVGALETLSKGVGNPNWWVNVGVEAVLGRSLNVPRENATWMRLAKMKS